MTDSSKPFVSEDYVPESYSGNYMKLTEGKHVVRILSEHAVHGFEYWTKDQSNNGTAHRVATRPTVFPDNVDVWEKDGKVKCSQFIAFTVWNYDEERVMLLVVKPITLRNNIIDMAQDPNYGHPRKYDLCITRTKKNDKTTYTVAPLPNKKMTDDELLIKIKQADESVDLDAYMRGEDPFAVREEVVNAQEVATVEDIAKMI